MWVWSASVAHASGASAPASTTIERQLTISKDSVIAVVSASVGQTGEDPVGIVPPGWAAARVRIRDHGQIIWSAALLPHYLHTDARTPRIPLARGEYDVEITLDQPSYSTTTIPVDVRMVIV